MRLCDLNYKNNAPKCGVMLAYSRERVYLEKYENIEELAAIVGDADLLEIHLFDQEREYRAVKSESKRWNRNSKGIIEKTVIGKADDDTYPVDVVLDKNFSKKLKNKSIRVLNYLVYDDNGAAMIDNYRLVEGRM